jgi:hypothetical protein
MESPIARRPSRIPAAKTMCAFAVAAGVVATGVLTAMPLSVHAQTRPATAPQTTVTADGLMVARALGLALDGQARATEIWPVRFRSEGARPKIDPDIRQRFFYANAVTFSRYSVIAGAPGVRVIEGLLSLEDVIGRHANTAFRSRYVVDAGGTLNVESATVIPIYLVDPRVRFGIVPADAVAAGWPLPRTPIEKLLELMAAHAVTRERRIGTGSGARDYVVVAIFMDRIAPADKIELRIGDRADDPAGDTPGTVTFAEGGWRAAALRARFDVNGGCARFIKVVLASAKATERPAKERLVSVFSTHLGGQPDPAPDIPKAEQCSGAG